MNIDDLVIDNYPKINLAERTIATEYNINSDEDISISVNNAIILDNDDISKVEDNRIYISSSVAIAESDIIAVIYIKEI